MRMHVSVRMYLYMDNYSPKGNGILLVPEHYIWLYITYVRTRTFMLHVSLSVSSSLFFTPKNILDDFVWIFPSRKTGDRSKIEIQRRDQMLRTDMRVCRERKISTSGNIQAPRADMKKNCKRK